MDRDPVEYDGVGSMVAGRIGDELGRAIDCRVRDRQRHIVIAIRHRHRQRHHFGAFRVQNCYRSGLHNRRRRQQSRMRILKRNGLEGNAGGVLPTRQVAPSSTAESASDKLPLKPESNPDSGDVKPPQNYSLAAPQTDTRRLTRQLEQAGWLGPAERAALTNRIYQVANLPAARAAAADLLAALGPERAAQTVLDVTIPIPGAVRSQLMQATARALAQQSPELYADFMNLAIHQTTDAGQFIAHLKGWAESTPEGAVATAQRILAGVAEHVLGSYQALLAAARTALDAAHTAAKADTLHAPDIQAAAAAAVDAAIATDPEVQQAVRAEARAGLANDETIRQAAAQALPPGNLISTVGVVARLSSVLALRDEGL